MKNNQKGFIQIKTTGKIQHFTGTVTPFQHRSGKYVLHLFEVEHEPWEDFLGFINPGELPLDIEEVQKLVPDDHVGLANGSFYFISVDSFLDYVLPEMEERGLA